MRRSWRLAQHTLAELLGLTVGELRATMTLPEFLSWQAYAKAKARLMDEPTPPAALPELGALGPAGVAAAIKGR